MLRGGWGIFYNLFDRVGSEDQLALNLPGLVNKTITATSRHAGVLAAAGLPGRVPERRRTSIRRPDSSKRSALRAVTERCAEDDDAAGELRHAA